MLTIEPTGAVLGGAVHGIENDLLIWDHLGTLHWAIADYRPDESA